MLWATGRRPRIAVLLGLAGAPLAQRVADPLRLPYASLPGFPQTGIAGHAGELLLGRIGAHEAVPCGRRHAYEGGDVAAMKGAIDRWPRPACRPLVQTNAAGSLDETMRPGRADDGDRPPQPRAALAARRRAHARRVFDLRDAYDPAPARRRRSASGAARRHHAARRRIRLVPAVRERRPRSACCNAWARRRWA